MYRIAYASTCSAQKGTAPIKVYKAGNESGNDAKV